jgi:hypothetical protein
MDSNELLLNYQKRLEDSRYRTKFFKDLAGDDETSYFKTLLATEQNIGEQLVKRADRLQRLIKLGQVPEEEPGEKPEEELGVEDEEVEVEQIEEEIVEEPEKKEITDEEIIDFNTGDNAKDWQDYKNYVQNVLKVDLRSKTVAPDSPYAPAINLTGYTDSEGKRHPGLVERFGFGRVMEPIIIKYSPLIGGVAGRAMDERYTLQFPGTSPVERQAEMFQILATRMLEKMKTYDPKKGTVGGRMSKKVVEQEFWNATRLREKATNLYKDLVCPFCRQPNTAIGEETKLPEEYILDNPDHNVWPPFKGSKEPEENKQKWLEVLKEEGEIEMFLCPVCGNFFRDGDQVTKTTAVAPVSLEAPIPGQEAEEAVFEEVIEDPKTRTPGEASEELKRLVSRTATERIAKDVKRMLLYRADGCRFDEKESKLRELKGRLGKAEKYNKGSDFYKVLKGYNINEELINEFQSGLVDGIADEMAAQQSEEALQEIRSRNEKFVSDMVSRIFAEETDAQLTQDKLDKIKLAAKAYMEGFKEFRELMRSKGRCAKNINWLYRNPCFGLYKDEEGKSKICEGYEAVEFSSAERMRARKYLLTAQAFIMVSAAVIEKKKRGKHYRDIKKLANEAIAQQNKELEARNMERRKLGKEPIPLIEPWTGGYDVVSVQGVKNALVKTIIPLFKMKPVEQIEGITGMTYDEALTMYLEELEDLATDRGTDIKELDWQAFKGNPGAIRKHVEFFGKEQSSERLGRMRELAILAREGDEEAIHTLRRLFGDNEKVKEIMKQETEREGACQTFLTKSSQRQRRSRLLKVRM